MKARTIAGALLFVLVILSPLAQLLRTQQPWTCFPLTWDESYFLQAIHGWAHDLGFRLHGDVKPFRPDLTIGLPLAWGTALVQRLTGHDWPQAGRLWIYLNSFVLFGLLAWTASRRARSAAAGVIAMGLFALFLSKAPAAPYLVYGLLGEVPGILIALLAALALDRKRFALAGALAALAFFTKPSFLLFVPALGLAALLESRRGGLKTALASAGGLLLGWLLISHARSESIFEYLGHFAKMSLEITRTDPSRGFGSFLAGMGPVTILGALLALGVGALGLARGRVRDAFAFARHPLTAGELAMWLHFAAGIVFFTVKGSRPVDKHWFVFYSLAAVLLSLRVGAWAGLKLAGTRFDEAVRPVFVTAVLVWAINVPPLARRDFRMAAENGCPVKEQRAIDRLLSEMARKGELKAGDVAGVAEFSSRLFLYELGWNPTYYGSWAELSVPPRFVVGDVATALPAPAGCSARWQGSTLALLHCQAR